MKLIIVDCLRWDVASDPEIMPNLNKKMNVYPIYTVANTTEPSLASILIGDYPHRHGFMGLGQKDSKEILRRKLPEEVKNWHMFSPAICFKPFTRFQKGKYYPEVELRSADETQIIHLMDMHDYKHRGEWRKFYDGYEELVDETEHMRYNLPKEKGWGRPWETHAGDIDDAGKLKAYYKAAAYNVDKWIGKLLERDETIIVTADHGEGFGEKGIVFRHQDLYDFMVRVPFACNKDIALPTLPDHTDICRIIEGKELRERRYSFQVENTWQRSFRVTDREGNYLIYHDPANRVYDHPTWEGDGRLQPILEKELEEAPDRPPALIEGQDLSIK